MKTHQYSICAKDSIPANQDFEVINKACKRYNRFIHDRGLGLYSEDRPLHEKSIAESEVYYVYNTLPLVLQNLTQVVCKESEQRFMEAT